MNKITVLLLLIGSAVLVIGLNRYEPVSNISETPWSVELTTKDNVKVLGLTLGETLLPAALNRFGKQGSSYLLVKSDQTLVLITLLEAVTFDRLIADIKLTYAVPQNKLRNLIQTNTTQSSLQKIRLSNEQLNSLNDAVVEKLSYQPSINYDEDLILQRFGFPDLKEQISENSQRWTYQDMHLQIDLNDGVNDKLVYTNDIPEI